MLPVVFRAGVCSPQGFYAGLPVCVCVVCTAIIAIFAAMTFKLYKLTDLAM